MSAIDGAEVAKHNSKKSCWIVIDSKVYDVTAFLSKHPGGAAIILKQAGTVSIRHEIIVYLLVLIDAVGRHRRIQEIPPVRLCE